RWLHEPIRTFPLLSRRQRPEPTDPLDPNPAAKQTSPLDSLAPGKVRLVPRHRTALEPAVLVGDASYAELPAGGVGETGSALPGFRRARNIALAGAVWFSEMAQPSSSLAKQLLCGVLHPPAFPDVSLTGHPV